MLRTFSANLAHHMVTDNLHKLLQFLSSYYQRSKIISSHLQMSILLTLARCAEAVYLACKMSSHDMHQSSCFSRKSTVIYDPTYLSRQQSLQCTWTHFSQAEWEVGQALVWEAIIFRNKIPSLVSKCLPSFVACSTKRRSLFLCSCMVEPINEDTNSKFVKPHACGSSPIKLGPPLPVGGLVTQSSPFTITN